VFSACVDIYLAIYPTVVLFKLQLPLRKKIALCIALGIGLVSGIVAIYKTTRIPALGSADFSYDTSDLVVWTVIEGSAIIIACSIPCLQPLMDAVLRRSPWSSRHTSRGATGGSRGTGLSGSKKNTNQRFYEDYSEHSKHNIELGQRKPKSKVRDDLGFTVIDGDDAGSSQENILASSHGVGIVGGPSETSGLPGTAHGVHDEEKGIEVITHSAGSSPPGDTGIVRTDAVTVSYAKSKPRRSVSKSRDGPW